MATLLAGEQRFFGVRGGGVFVSFSIVAEVGLLWPMEGLDLIQWRHHGVNLMYLARIELIGYLGAFINVG